MFIGLKVDVRSFEVGLLFEKGEFVRLVGPGRHRRGLRHRQRRIEVVSMRDPFFHHEQLDLMVRSGALTGKAEIVDLADHQRALVWVDGRFARILDPGLHAIWNTQREVRVEIVETSAPFFEHAERDAIVDRGGSTRFHVVDVATGTTCLYLVEGKLDRELAPGRHVLWKTHRRVDFLHVDLRDRILDVCGQDIMTSDRVTLRLNLVVAYRVDDPRKAVLGNEDHEQALYREAQLALRGAVGSRSLDQMLADKATVAGELQDGVAKRAAELGLEVRQVGVKDVILPGEMRALLNRVTEAKAAAEANLISRREETAAMRSQANTAKLLADNPTLMRLHELEVVKAIASSGKLEVILGDRSLADKITKLI